jgi:adenine-specific DNA-methyltransferase
MTRARRVARQLGFFETPAEIAELLSLWAVRSQGDRVLDPCAGTGALVKAALARSLSRRTRPRLENIIAVEKRAAFAPVLEGISNTRTIIGDFLKLVPDEVGPVDVVLANPPFVRVRHMPSAYQVKLTDRFPVVGRRGSLWAYFLVHALEFLKAKSGRLAFVLPWQLVTTQYGRDILEIVCRRFASVELLMLTWDIFPAAQVRSLLLLAHGYGYCARPAVRTVSSMKTLRNIFATTTAEAGKLRPILLSDRLGERETQRLQSIAAAARFVPLSTVFSIRIGLVTGCDSFFTLSRAEIRKWRIPRCCLYPILPHARWIDGVELLACDLRTMRELNAKCRLFRPCEKHTADPTAEIRAYLKLGKSLNVDRRFKCRTRRLWFKPPSATPPSYFLTYMNHCQPRLIFNAAQVGATNRLHYLSFRTAPAAANGRIHSFAFINYLTQATAELAGRSYGGGVLKLEPSDCARVSIIQPEHPALSSLSESITREADAHLKMGERDSCAEIISEALLGAVGIGKNDREFLKDYYLSLRGQRTDIRAEHSRHRSDRVS